MSTDTATFEPKIVAYVCNWCTYLGADLAGTNRLEYPANVRIIRLPCTGRIDFNLIVKAFEVGADSVLVSGCHPGDCHYTAGNYHARRRWTLFRPLLEVFGFDMRRIHFTWISAAEGKKFQHVISELTEQTRALGPANYLRSESSVEAPDWTPPQRSAPPPSDGEEAMRRSAREMLASGTVKLVIGYDSKGTPAFAVKPEDADRLAFNERAKVNLAVYLKRKEIRSAGRIGLVTPPVVARTLNVLEAESQVDRENVVEIAVDRKSGPPSFAALDEFMAFAPEQRMAWWRKELERCVKCYACRASCPMCYCERCIADKNRPQSISPSATAEGNFAWHIARAFHQAGRCVGCGECARACPAGIPLGLLNQAIGRVAAEQFAYRAGAERGVEPLIGHYSLSDKEDFIR